MNREQKIEEAIENICERLTERTATLFLGAGINHGIKNDDGISMPLGTQLGDWIARDLLDSEGFGSLTEPAEMARMKCGAEGLNKYLFEKFSVFRPGAGHLSLVQLPWESIYTTNYDLLVEDAARGGIVAPAGEIRQIYCETTPLDQFHESDILYYKLHGTIDFAGTEDGRLILTNEDFRYYEERRVRLFRRLKTDLMRRTMVFVGYSMIDDNFQRILQDCRKELAIESFPLSYSVRPGFKDAQEVFWREKYNIQLLDCDGSVFLNRLKENWQLQNRSVIPFADRQNRKYGFAGEGTTFEKVGESFYLLNPNDCTTPSDPSKFFKGGAPTWGDIRERIAPARDLYWTIFNAIFEEMASPSEPSSTYLITGSAGTGKTTLLRTLAFDIRNEFNNVVLLHITGTPLETRFLGTLFDRSNPMRLFIVIESAGDKIEELEQFLEELREKKMPVTVLLEERKNQWAVAASLLRNRKPIESFEFDVLSSNEINRIIDALNQFSCLEKLGDLPRSDQISHFEKLAHKDLLVALRELTTQSSFDEIIKDEFHKIESSVARNAYTYVSALGRIDLAVRYETLQHILSIDYSELRKLVFEPTEGVLISCEETGNSRHNAGFRLRTRHPIIASIIFDESAKDDTAKFEILNQILSNLDTGHLEDKKILHEIVRKRDIVNAFASPEIKRALYERLAILMPRNAYVYQHRSILEKEIGDFERAENFARLALRMDENNPALINTLGLALEFSARKTKDITKNQLLLAEAMRLFENGLHRNPSDPYAYLGKVYVLQQRIEQENSSERRELLTGSILSILEEAMEATDESPIIANQLAKFRQELGAPEVAAEVLKKALLKNTADTRLRDSLIRLLVESGRIDDAYALSVEGQKADPRSWRMERHLARLSARLNKTTNKVKSHFEAAVRLNKADVSLLVELGAFLYSKLLFSEADAIFDSAKKLPISSNQKLMIREWLRTSQREVHIFDGKVSQVKSSGAIAISIPENYQAFFHRNRPGLSDLKTGDNLQFKIGFNAYGAYATVELPARDQEM